MAVALGLSPREVEAIADEDPATYGALVVAAREKWSTTEELLAGIYEMTQANYRISCAIAGVKEKDLPKVIRVPRPGDIEAAKTETKKATPSEFAGWMRQRNGGG